MYENTMQINDIFHNCPEVQILFLNLLNFFDIKSKNTSNLISLSFKVPFERFFHIFCNIWFKKIENWVRTCPHIGDIFIFTIKDIMYVPLLKIKLFKEQKESKNNKDYKYLYKEKRREVWNHILLSLWIYGKLERNTK